MNGLYPYSVWMLNVGRYGYMHRITNNLVAIEEAKTLLNDANDLVREGAVQLIEELRETIAEIEQDAEERYNDWATDNDYAAG